MPEKEETVGAGGATATEQAPPAEVKPPVVAPTKPVVTAPVKPAVVPAKPPPVAPAQTKPVEKKIDEAPHGWIFIRDITLSLNHQTLTFRRRDVITDKYIINAVKEAYKEQCPIRPQKEEELFQ